MNLKKPMSVLVIGWEYPPHITGGLGIACQGLVRALIARGHKVRFLLPKLYGDEQTEPGLELIAPVVPDDLSADERERLSRGLEQLAEAAVVVSPYDSQVLGSDERAGRGLQRVVPGATLPLEGGYGATLYSQILLYAELAGMLAARQQPDVIHAHDWMCFPAGLAARHSSGRPLVCHVHATEFDRSGAHPNPLVYDIERRALHECDRVVAVSRYTREVLVREYGIEYSRVSVVYNGIDLTDRQGPAPAHERPLTERVVLFVGRMTFQKGPDYFVRAAHLVIQKMPGVRFVMAGGGDMYHRMIEFAADLGIGSHFHYTGPLSAADVQRLFRTSDLYILPSVSEPFGITPLEAIAHGVPVIISKQAGVGELVEGCLKVDFWDVEELASKIVALLSDPTLAASLQERSREEVAGITWERSALQLEEVFERVLLMGRAS